MPVLVILRRISADLIEDVGEDVGAIEAQAGAADRVLVDLVARLHDGAFKGFRIGAGDRARADDRDRLQVLRAHDGADAAPSGGAVEIVHDAGEQHPVLAGRPNAGDLRVVVGLGANGVRRLRNILAPQMRGVANLDLGVLDPQIDWFRRRAFDDHSVVSGKFQCRTPCPARVRGSNGASERAFGHDGVAARRGRECAGQRTGHEDQLVFRRQRIDLWIDLIGHDFRAETARADIVLGEAGIQRFRRHFARRQIHAEHFANPSVHDLTPRKRA